MPRDRDSFISCVSKGYGKGLLGEPSQRAQLRAKAVNMLLRSLGENETETGPGPGYDNPAVTCLYIFRNIDGRTLATQVLLRHCSEEDRFGAGEAAAVYLLNGLMASGL